MNKKTKMILDVIMTILFICLMKISFIGIALHEIIGIGIFVLFIVHKLLNYKWIAAMCSNIFTGKAKGKSKFMFILDAVLLLLTGFIVLSGILISQVLFTKITVNNIGTWSELHHFAAYSALILLSVHIGLHWQMIMNFFKKVFRMKNEDGTRTWLARGLALAIAVVGIRALCNPSIQSNFTAPFVSEVQSTALNTKAKNSDENQASIAQSAANGLAVETPTLEDYLSKLVCSGCHRRCPLTNLGCGRGNAYKEQAIIEYQQKYSQNNNSSGSSDSIPESNGSTPAVPDSNESAPPASGSNESTPAIPDSNGSAPAASGSNESAPPASGSNESAPPASDSNGSAPAAPEGKAATPVDYIGIMGFVIAGTHYIVTIPKKSKQK